MKTRFTILLSLLLLATATARIGEDAVQVRARYGVETRSTEAPGGYISLSFVKNHLFVHCILHHGKTVFIAYSPTDSTNHPLDIDTAEVLIKANQGADPMILLGTKDGTTKSVFTNSDKSVIGLYSPDDPFYKLVIARASFYDDPKAPAAPVPEKPALKGF